MPFTIYTGSTVSDLSRNVGLGVFEQNDFLREELLVINAQAIFCLLLFLVGINVHTKKSTAH